MKSIGWNFRNDTFFLWSGKRSMTRRLLQKHFPGYTSTGPLHLVTIPRLLSSPFSQAATTEIHSANLFTGGRWSGPVMATATTENSRVLGRTRRGMYKIIIICFMCVRMRDFPGYQ